MTESRPPAKSRNPVAEQDAGILSHDRLQAHRFHPKHQLADHWKRRGNLLPDSGACKTIEGIEPQANSANTFWGILFVVVEYAAIIRPRQTKLSL